MDTRDNNLSLHVLVFVSTDLIVLRHVKQETSLKLSAQISKVISLGESNYRSPVFQFMYLVLVVHTITESMRSGKIFSADVIDENLDDGSSNDDFTHTSP